MARLVSAENLSDDNLAWLWAAQNCLLLFDQHDSTWIELSSKNGWEDDDLISFLKAYGLLRGHNGSKLANSKGNRTRFGETVRKLVAKQKPECLNEAGLVWDEICNELAVQEIALSKNGLRSAASKLLWFHLPNCWTMQDRYNFGSLHSWLRESRGVKKHPFHISEFTKYFSEFYYQNEVKAKWASSSITRRYPYPIRVAEKYLWLKGSGKQAKVVEHFKHSLSVLRLNVEKPCD